MIPYIASPSPGGLTGTYTVNLNLNDSNPLTWATYADDAVGMEAGSADWDSFFGHYPCIVANGAEGDKLDPNDYTKTAGGSAAPITTLGNDVMVCYPRRGLKLKLSGNILSVSMTTEEGKSGYSYMAHSYKGVAKDRFYLAAYKGHVDGNKLYSVSGQVPTTNLTIGNFRSYAQARGTGYEQSAFYQLTFRQAMYVLKYKGQNAQIAVGRGFVDGNSAIYGNTGYTNDKGMDWGESTGKFPMKLFGLEDFYGNIYEFIDGIYSGSSRELLAADGNYNDTGSGYITVSSATASSNWSGYLRYPVGTNAGGFAPLVTNTNKGDKNTYFCDYAGVYAARLGAFGGNWANAGYAGVFLLDVSRSATYTNAYCGARLMFFPS